MTISIEDRLKKLGIKILDCPKPIGSYIPCVKSCNLIFMSGILPLINGKIEKTGRVGEGVSLEDAQKCARQTVINALSILKSFIGDLDKISKCIKINGYVASADSFTEQHKVLNAASDLLFEIFEEKGRHTRTAIGVSALPLNSPIEIDFVFEIVE